MLSTLGVRTKGAIVPRIAPAAQMLFRQAHVQRGKNLRTAYLRRKAEEQEYERKRQREGYYYQGEQSQQAYATPPANGRIIQSTSLAASLLSQSSLRVTRNMEMLNIFLGYEQANRYTLMDPQGNPVGFMIELSTFARNISRQLFRLHRPFDVIVMDLNGQIALQVKRPFSFINSRIFVSDNNGSLIGESQQEWHLWRRRYNMFTSNGDNSGSQFARVDAPFLSWDFSMNDEEDKIVGGVYRDFAGIGAELFSDYGLYAICFDKNSLSQRFQNQTAPTGSPVYLPAISDNTLDLDKRAVALATAISIDFDYFSRHSKMGGGGFFFFPMFGGTGEYNDGGLGGDI